MLALGVGITLFTIHQFTLESEEIRELRGTDVTLVGTVTSAPQPTQSRVIGSRVLPVRSSFIVRSSRICKSAECWKVRLPFRILTEEIDAFPGVKVEIRGKLVESKEYRVSALIVADQHPTVIEQPSAFFRGIEVIRRDFRTLAKQKGGDGATLIPGLVMGDTSLQSQDLRNAMRSAGLSHLTAVSGANFAIVSAFVIWGSSWFIRRRNLQSLITFLILVSFVALVHPSPSVLRAAVMAVVVLIARTTGDLAQSSASLAVAISALLLIDPLQGLDPGFILSVLATSALIFLAPLIEIRLSTFLWPWLAQSIAVSTAATIICSPYILFLAGEISTATVYFNLLVAPVIAPITILGLGAALSAPFSEGLAFAVLRLIEPLAQWIVRVAYQSENVSSLSVAPSVVLLLLITFVGTRKLKKLAPLLVAVILLYLAFSHLSFPGRNWMIGQCDVGQGDALLLRSGRKEAILFDAGPDPRALKRCLRKFGVTSISLAVISHHHADHTEGLVALRRIPVRQIWVNTVQSAELITHYGVNAPIVVAKFAEKAEIGGVVLKVLGPKNQEEKFSAISGDGSQENNLSLVVQATLNGVSILVTGDIEPEGQGQITLREDLSSISILKVAHHGSRYQDHDFLAEMQPVISLVSVGAGNTYGHPAPATIAELVSLGSEVLRTDRDGALAISWRPKVRGNRDSYVFWAKREGKEWWSIRWR